MHSLYRFFYIISFSTVSFSFLQNPDQGKKPAPKKKVQEPVPESSDDDDDDSDDSEEEEDDSDDSD